MFAALMARLRPNGGDSVAGGDARCLPLDSGMSRSVSATKLDHFAPLEMGARLELRAKLQARASHILGRALLLAMIYLVALELFPQSMKPGGALWALLLVWVCAYHGGAAFERIGLPKALGMLVAGLVLQSLPHASHLAFALDHLTAWWSKDIRAAAMAVVLLRAGLGLDISTVTSYGWCLPAMATLPSLIESVIGAAIASRLFDMPYTLAWVMSFMVSAVGPAIIASGCAAVKERNFAPAAPNFLMTTAVFDDTTCIIGFNCLLHASIPSGGNVGWQYAIGPMNLVLGVFGGVVAAVTMSATALFPSPAVRTWTLFFVGMMLIFVAEKHELLGAGAIANLIFGLGVRYFWKKGWPASLLSPEHAADPAGVGAAMLKASLGGLYTLWNLSFYPLLFGLIGASLNVRQADPATGRLALAYAVIAVCLRFFATMLVTHAPVFRNFTTRERIFMSLAWISKATTQAAFATVPLLTLTAWVAANPGQMWRGRTGAQLIQHGLQIQWCCVLSIFIGTPLGTIFMNNGAKYLLKPMLTADAAAPIDERAGGPSRDIVVTVPAPADHAANGTTEIVAAGNGTTELVAAGNGSSTAGA